MQLNGFHFIQSKYEQTLLSSGRKASGFLVSSISKERYSNTREGKPGSVDYGYDYREREVTLSFFLRHFHDEHDYLLLRDELYGF